MKKILAALGILLLLAVAGVVAGVWYLRSGIAFGIDEAHPLGRLAEVESYLVKVGLEKDEAALNSLSKALLGRQVIYYVEPLPEDSDLNPDRVTVTADTDGVIREVIAELRVDPPGKSVLPSKVRLLCGYYWNAAGGRTPDFSSSDPTEEPTEGFTREAVQGGWTRTTSGERMRLRVR